MSQGNDQAQLQRRKECNINKAEEKSIQKTSSYKPLFHPRDRRTSVSLKSNISHINKLIGGTINIGTKNISQLKYELQMD